MKSMWERGIRELLKKRRWVGGERVHINNISPSKSHCIKSLNCFLNLEGFIEVYEIHAVFQFLKSRQFNVNVMQIEHINFWASTNCFVSVGE